MRLSPERVAAEARAEVVSRGADEPPARAVVDSREVQPGDLFVGLPGERVDGGAFAAGALAAGAWGALVADPHAAGAAEEGRGWVLAAPDPLRALQRLARAWRRELGCEVVGITGSVGKTSVKDICHAILPRRVHVSPANYNTEVGLPLAVLSAPADAEVMVLEMAMRGLGQIAELCEIAEPDVAAITNIGPVHLELLGTIEAIAEAKAEIIQGLGERGRAVVPEDAEALEPHLHDELVTITFGPGGEVFTLSADSDRTGTRAVIGTPHGEQPFSFPFGEAHNLDNALCAIAVGVALDLPLAEMAARAPQVVFSRLRGELIDLADGILVVNDCYNANPVSMRAALEHLRSLGGPRAVAVLGGMAELGPAGPSYHREVGALARELGIGPIVGVGELARDYAPDAWAPDADQAAALVVRRLRSGDRVLVKGSRAIGLEHLTDALVAQRGGTGR